MKGFALGGFLIILLLFFNLPTNLLKKFGSGETQDSLHGIFASKPVSHLLQTIVIIKGI